MKTKIAKQGDKDMDNVLSIEKRFAGYERNPVMSDLKTLVVEILAPDSGEKTGATGGFTSLFEDSTERQIAQPDVHLISNEAIKDIIESIGHLFTLPDHVMRITQIIQSHQATVDDVCDEIAKDPSLSAEILKIVNSSFYGLQHQISSIKHAVVILGFNVIHALVLSTSVVTMASIKELWSHSETCAKACAMLAQRAGLSKIEEIGVIGLLHDIGKVVLEEYLPDKFVSVRKLMNRERIPLYDAERIVLGCTHAEIGQWLLEKWNLPPDTSAPIGNHHNIDINGRYLERTLVVHTADVLVNALFSNPDNGVMMPALHPVAFRTLKLGADDVRWIMEALVAL